MFVTQVSWQSPLGAFHYTNDSGSVRIQTEGFVSVSFDLEVVHLFRLEYADRNSSFHF